MAYDSAISSFTTKTNKVDLVDASHINTVQAELVVIETILGTNVKGNQADLKTRLNNMLDADGSVLSGTSYPSPGLTSQIFFRTDLDQLSIRKSTGWANASQQASAFLVRLTDATTTPATFDETGGFDSNGDFTSNVFTAPITAKYIFCYAFQWTKDNSVTLRSPIVAFRKNGATFITRTLPTTTALDIKYWDISIVLNLTAGDTIDMLLTQTTSSTFTINDITQSHFSGGILNGA